MSEQLPVNRNEAQPRNKVVSGSTAGVRLQLVGLQSQVLQRRKQPRPGERCRGCCGQRSRGSESLSVTSVATPSGQEMVSPLLRNSRRLSAGGWRRGGEGGRRREVRM